MRFIVDTFPAWILVSWKCVTMGSVVYLVFNFFFLLFLGSWVSCSLLWPSGNSDTNTRVHDHCQKYPEKLLLWTKLPNMVAAHCLASIWQFALSAGQVVKTNIKIDESQIVIVRVLHSSVLCICCPKRKTQMFFLVFYLNTNA